MFLSGPGSMEQSPFTPPRMWGGCIGVDHAAALVPRFIPTHVGRMLRHRAEGDAVLRFIPTHVGRIPNTLRIFYQRKRFIPTHVGRMYPAPLLPAAKVGSSPRTWGGFLCLPPGIQFVYRFIPTHVGRMRNDPNQLRGPPRFIPTHVGRIAFDVSLPSCAIGSSPRTWGGCYSGQLYA